MRCTNKSSILILTLSQELPIYRQEGNHHQDYNRIITTITWIVLLYQDFTKFSIHWKLHARPRVDVRGEKRKRKWGIRKHLPWQTGQNDLLRNNKYEFYIWYGCSKSFFSLWRTTVQTDFVFPLYIQRGVARLWWISSKRKGIWSAQTK